MKSGPRQGEIGATIEAADLCVGRWAELCLGRTAGLRLGPTAETELGRFGG